MSIKGMMCAVAVIAGVSMAGQGVAGSKGDSSDTRVEQALTHQAQGGDAEAQRLLGAWYSDKDSGKAVHWYRLAAKDGDADAVAALGQATRDGALGLKADWNRGMSLLQQAADAGNGDAIYALDYCCDPNPGRLAYAPPRDGVERLRWDLDVLGRADADSDIDALQDSIAELGRAGEGVHITRWRLAFLRDQIAAEDGDIEALQRVADAYFSGHGVTPDTALAEHWFQRLADDGAIDHQMSVADHYAAGDFGAGREAMATVYYRRAADLLTGKAMAGDGDAQIRLAVLYADHELGAADSDAQAVAWYGRAAATGNVTAEAGLGRLVLTGKGVAADADKGLALLTLAADNNNQRLAAGEATATLVDIQLDLARIYSDGALVPRNDYLAWYWFEVGRTNMPQDAGLDADAFEIADVSALQEAVQARLDAGQLAQAQAAAIAWHTRFDAGPTIIAINQK